MPVTKKAASAKATSKPATKVAKTRKAVDKKQQKYEDIHFVDSSKPVWAYSRFAPEDIQNYHQGTLYRAYDLFGSHSIEVLNTKGYYFAVWAPNATSVSVIGNFNDWMPHKHELYARLDKSGIWEGFIPHLTKGEVYKYRITGFNGAEMDKGDPYARFWEKKPLTASITWDGAGYEWQDAGWMAGRKQHNSLQSPWNVYEMHLGSWIKPDANNEDRYNTYGEIAERLVPYLTEMGFTHVELMPVMEHPYDGSWGYQGTGYFAPTSRYGSPEDFKALIDALHQAGIGVILDWVPSHFPYDSHGLFMFDGTHTYEYADMRKGYHPDWSSYIFNYKRNEVKCFLISSARYWFEHFHIDGIRVDAVSSMLKLDYSREEGAWEPNEFGGNGNIEAIAFLKQLNEMIYRDFEGVQTIAEEATDWPGVTRPTFTGGLGFGMKWMMGWMHDTLNYFKRNPIHRQHHQNQITFSMMYYGDENFMLPISHDEVVHGKSPMLYKMPGNEWEKFANLRLLYTYMFTHPGGKLLFMGSEFGATNEWNHKSELQWNLLQFEPHGKLKNCVRDILHLTKGEKAFYEKQFDADGFEWIETNRREESILAYMRKGSDAKDNMLVILNMTPVHRKDYPIYVKQKKDWKEVFNSDSKAYWGTGDLYNATIQAKPVDNNSEYVELRVQLPALGAVILK